MIIEPLFWFYLGAVLGSIFSFVCFCALAISRVKKDESYISDLEYEVAKLSQLIETP